MRVELPKEKVEKIKKQMPISTLVRKSLSEGLSKVVGHTVHCPTDSNPIRCFQVRLGSSVPRAISWWPLVTRGKKGAYQPSRIESSSYGCIDFRAETKTRANSLADGQSGCLCVHKKNGGTVNQKMKQVSKELWDNPP